MSRLSPSPARQPGHWLIAPVPRARLTVISWMDTADVAETPEHPHHEVQAGRRAGVAIGRVKPRPRFPTGALPTVQLSRLHHRSGGLVPGAGGITGQGQPSRERHRPGPHRRRRAETQTSGQFGLPTAPGWRFADVVQPGSAETGPHRLVEQIVTTRDPQSAGSSRSGRTAARSARPPQTQHLPVSCGLGKGEFRCVSMTCCEPFHSQPGRRPGNLQAPNVPSNSLPVPESASASCQVSYPDHFSRHTPTVRPPGGAAKSSAEGIPNKSLWLAATRLKPGIQ